MLGDGQLLKNDKGKYYPTNPTNLTNPANPVGNGDAMVSGVVDGPGATNRTFADTYAENGASISEVSEVSGHRRLTAAEAERVQALISQGMSPKLARAEVLGEEV
jgi:fructose-1-phosphate kinase PfkB-like protein